MRAASLRVTGAAVPVVEELLAQSGGEQVDNGSAQFDVADNGTLVYLPDRGLGDALSLVLVDQEGTRASLGLEPGGYMSPRFSPDGGSLTVHIGNETGSDVWIIDLARGSRTRVTSRVNSVMPFFNPDGRSIAYASSGEADGSELYWRNANQMMAAAIEASDTGFVPNQPRELFVGGFLGGSDFPTYDVNPNGDGFVMLVAGGDSGVDGTTISEHVTMVFDFFSVLREATRSR